MFNYIKKEYQFTDEVEFLRTTIRKAIDNSSEESITGVLDNDDSFWIRDKHNFSFKSFPTIPTRVYGEIISGNNKSIILIRIVPDTIYFYLQLIGFIIIIVDQINKFNFLHLIGGLGFIIAVSGVAYLDSRLINKKFERVFRKNK